MRIGILTTRKPKTTEDSHHLERLKEAAVKHGHEIFVIHESELVLLEQSGKIEILYEDAPLPNIDVIVNQLSCTQEPSLHTITTESLMQAGYRVINCVAMASVSRNKLAQHVRLTQAGIPMPRWAIARTPERAAKAAEEIGFPLMIKLAFGTRGKGVFFAKDRETFLPIVDYLAVRDGNPVILESFIEEAERSDLRVFIVGGTIIASMERTAKNGDVRANASIGGVGEAVELSEAEKKIALKATDAFGLDIAGVDILRSKDGPLVMEVNANPGFEELERATGVDVAGAIIAFVTKG